MHRRCFTSEQALLKSRIVHLQIVWHSSFEWTVADVIKYTMAHRVVENSILLLIVVDFGESIVHEWCIPVVLVPIVARLAAVSRAQ